MDRSPNRDQQRLGSNHCAQNSNHSKFSFKYVRLKDEDRFQACEDLRPWHGQRGIPRGSVLATYAVFDGHVTDLAAKFCEREWLRFVEKAIEHERMVEQQKQKQRKRSQRRESRESQDSEDHERGATPYVRDLEQCLIEAVRDLERAFRESALEEDSAKSVLVYDDAANKRGGCFKTCFGAKRKKVPLGGTTITSVSIQRGENDDVNNPNEASFDIVCASLGDSGALLLPHPNEHDADDPEVDLRSHKRLTREHNVDDPLEAVRLNIAGCRLGRMQRADGNEIGPLRAYPGGFAVSRAVGDFASPAIICEPEITRVKIPKTGARVLVATDGVFAAISDGDLSQICATLSTSDECVDAIIKRVLKVRGRHDDITILIVDIPPPKEYIKMFENRDVEKLCKIEIVRKTRAKLRMNKLTAHEQRATGNLNDSFDRAIGEDDYVLKEDDFFIDDVADDITVHGFRGTRKQTLVFDEYQIGALLGRGAFGSVRIAVRRFTGEVCAVKSVLKSNESKKQIMNEIDTLRYVSGKHPNLPILHGIYQDKLNDNGICYIVTEICGGSSLFDSIARRRWFDENDWRAITAQLLGAVSFMHSLGVCHRDIKPDNIMCKNIWTREPNSVPHLKLIDFGSAIFCSAGEKLKGMHGTKFFASPEMCGDMQYTKKTDVWSVGVVLLTLLSGFPDGPAIMQVWHNMLRGIFPKLDDSTPTHFIKLIRALLTVNANDRPACGEVLGVADDWLRFSWSSIERSKSVMDNKLMRPAQAQKLKIPKNNFNGANVRGKNIQTIDYDLDSDKGSKSSGTRSGGISPRNSVDITSLGPITPIKGKKYNAGLLTAENLFLLEQRGRRPTQNNNNEISSRSESSDHEEKGPATVSLSDLSSIDDRPRKKWHSESGAELNNSVKRIAASVLATEYEKHVANVLSVCASPEEIRKTLINLEKMIQHDPKVAASVRAGGSNIAVHARVTARDLEDATRAAGAGEVAAQLATLRRFHEPPGRTLTLDIEPLRDLEKLHERHDHVFKAVGANADSLMRIREYTRMDNDIRNLVQSNVHTEMVMAMLGKGFSSNNTATTFETESVDGKKKGVSKTNSSSAAATVQKKWITEMLDDSVLSGVVGKTNTKTIEDILEERKEEERFDEVLQMIHRS